MRKEEECVGLGTSMSRTVANLLRLWQQHLLHVVAFFVQL